MKLVILSLCVTYALADVSHIVGPNKDQSARIVEHNQDESPDGSYQWNIKTENGIKAAAQGAVDNSDPEKPSHVVQGHAEWISPDGEPVSFEYIADSNGFQPQGSHIPTPPPIPVAIIRALEWIRSHPPQEDSIK